MAIPAEFEKQVKSILINVAEIRKFTRITEVYYTESTSFLKRMMEKTGIEYNTDIENLRFPFQDETLSYAFTQLISHLLQYEKSAVFLTRHLDEFDQQTARQLASVFDSEEHALMRNKVILEIAENIESLHEEKNQIIQMTTAIEKTIRELELRLSAYFN